MFHGIISKKLNTDTNKLLLSSPPFTLFFLNKFKTFLFFMTILSLPSMLNKCFILYERIFIHLYFTLTLTCVYCTGTLCVILQ